MSIYAIPPDYFVSACVEALADKMSDVDLNGISVLSEGGVRFVGDSGAIYIGVDDLTAMPYALQFMLEIRIHNGFVGVPFDWLLEEDDPSKGDTVEFCTRVELTDVLITYYHKVMSKVYGLYRNNEGDLLDSSRRYYVSLGLTPWF